MTTYFKNFRTHMGIAGVCLVIIVSVAAAAELSPQLMMQWSNIDVRSMAVSPDGKYILCGGQDMMATLWDRETGRVLRRFIGHSGMVSAVAFIPNSRHIASGGDSTVRVWDMETGKELIRLNASAVPGRTGFGTDVTSLAISPDGRTIFVGRWDYSASLWDVGTGRSIKTFPISSSVLSVALSGSSGLALTGGIDLAEVWDIGSGRKVATFRGHRGRVNAVALSANGREAVTGAEDGSVRLWNTMTGSEVRRYDAHKDGVFSVVLDSGKRRILTGGGDSFVRLWDMDSGRRLAEFRRGGPVYSAVFSPQGDEVLATGVWDGGAIRRWSLETKADLPGIRGTTVAIYDVAFSPDGRKIAVGGSSGTQLVNATERTLQPLVSRGGHVSFHGMNEIIVGQNGSAEIFTPQGERLTTTFRGNSRARPVVSQDGRHVVTADKNVAILWDRMSGNAIRQFTGHTEEIYTVALSPNGRTLATGGRDHSIRLWDVGSGTLLRLISQHSSDVFSLAFNPGGTSLLSGSYDGTIRLWDPTSGTELRLIPFKGPGGFAAPHEVVFSPDGARFVAGGFGAPPRIWDVSTGRVLGELGGATGAVTGISFSKDGRFIALAKGDEGVEIFDARLLQLLATLAFFQDGTWAVVARDGLFDASSGGDTAGLHWVVGLEPIALSQLKERYYEPGLLSKIMGFNKEPLRDVKAFKGVALYPTVDVTKPTAGDPTLGIKLTNRGGGIGKVAVWLNGKEVTADATRGKSLSPDARTAELSVNLKDHPYLIAGKKNQIEVKAYNTEGYLSSRGVIVVYEAPGLVPSEVPTLWAIVSGISDYRGTAIDLGYAAKDAVDVANAVRLGASRLLGAGHVQISLLTTESVSGAAEPTKKTLVEAFNRAQKARSTDILLVYLSGHGVTYGGAEGDYYYLTRDAMTADLSDPAVRQAVALSSNELSDLIRAIPATKQVLVLDTCGAGKAVEALSAKRDISSSQIRALERMKDRFGLFILGGATADKVSYEASRFGQGLLTYSLLVGLQKGAALREGRFIDVSTLFDYAVDSVPAMAKDIGGIQQPIKAIPQGGASFDIGELTREDREQIKVASPKPFVLSSDFQDTDQFKDHLTLAQRVNDQLRNISARGREAPIVFVDAGDAPDAYSVVGRYRCQDQDVTADVRVFKGGKEVARYTEYGRRAEVDDLAQKIVARAQEIIRQQPR